MPSKSKLQIIKQAPEPDNQAESESDNELQYKPITKSKLQNKKIEDIQPPVNIPVQPVQQQAPQIQYIYVPEPPKRKKMELSEEEKRKRAERLKEARNKRAEQVNYKNQEQARLLEEYKKEQEKKALKKLEALKRKAQREHVKNLINDEMDYYAHTDTEDNGGRRGGNNSPPQAPIYIQQPQPVQQPIKPRIKWG